MTDLALGRMKAGRMNKTEAAYAARLDELKAAGEILWHSFEGVTLRLADRTRARLRRDARRWASRAARGQGVLAR